MRVQRAFQPCSPSKLALHAHRQLWFAEQRLHATHPYQAAAAARQRCQPLARRSQAGQLPQP